MCNELGRLSQGYKSIKGNDIIFFILKSKIPKGKRVTYARIVCTIRSQKSKTHRVRLTARGNFISYADVTSTPTATITIIKAHWNSIISTPGAKYAILNIKDFYLNSKLKNYEHVKIHINLIPQDFINAYNLNDIVDDEGFINMKIRGDTWITPSRQISIWWIGTTA